MKDNTKTLINELIKEFGFVDSSLLNSCSCRVHDNPLFSDCVTEEGRLHSDLEYALTHDTSPSALALIQNVRDVVSKRSTWDMPSGRRHVSLSEIYDVLQSHDVEDASEDLQTALDSLSDSSTDEPAATVGSSD